MGLMPERIGILGGAFDPPHQAHVAMAEAAIQQFQLDGLHIIPTGEAWHKPRHLTSAGHREAMTQLAFGHLHSVVINCIELHRNGPSYTIDTLRVLSQQHPTAQFFLFIGEDQEKALASWHQIEEIAQRAIICVAERDMADPHDLFAFSHNLPTLPLKLPKLPHSATEVRALVAQGQSIDALVPQNVALYIQRHHLYQLER
jgi:nicotinate-nucleotide adenylyltransferase